MRARVVSGEARTVLVLQTLIPPYRVRLFDLMHQHLLEQGVKLRVAWGGESYESGAANLDPAAHEWSAPLPSVALSGGRGVWQMALHEVLRADAVVFEHAARVVSNPAYWALCRAFGRPVALWGQGMNRGGGPSLVESLKRRTLTYSDWWFTYTPGTADYLAGNGVPESIITTLNNSSDTTELGSRVSGLSRTQLESFRAEQRIGADDLVALFAGRLTSNKGLDVLLESARILQGRMPEFRLVILGDGPLWPQVSEVAGNLRNVSVIRGDWGIKKASAFAVADVLVHGGSLGLAVTDALACGLPVVHRTDVHHGPEAEYLRPGITSVQVESSSPEGFSSAIAELLTDRQRLVCMSIAARESAQVLSIETMAARFSSGIIAWISRSFG